MEDIAKTGKKNREIELVSKEVRTKRKKKLFSRRN